MQQHEWILLSCCSTKEARHKCVHVAWFPLCWSREGKNHTMVIEVRLWFDLGESTGRIFWSINNCLYLGGFLGVYMCKNHWTTYLRFVHFILCELYLSNIAHAPTEIPPHVYVSLNLKVKSLSHVWLFATPWTVACQAPQSMEFSRQEYWIGLPFPPPGDLPNPGIEPGSPALPADALPSEPPGSSAQIILFLLKQPFPLLVSKQRHIF